MTKRLFGLSLAYKASVCAVMVITLAVYWIRLIMTFSVYPNYWILCLLLLPGICIPLIILRQIRHETLKGWSSWFFFIESLFTLLMAYSFFEGPMHDIALEYFGHHGRFGAEDLDNGNFAYLLNDVTIPLILFLPVMALGILFFAENRIARSKRD